MRRERAPRAPRRARPEPVRPPRARRPRRASTPRHRLPWLLFGVLLGILLARWGEAPPSLPPDGPAEGPVCAEALPVATGTCACPAPKKKHPIARKPPRATPLELPAQPPEDATGRALRSAASRLQRCADPAGEPSRLHLGVEVEPSGRVQRVLVRNVERGPANPVGQCVRSAILTLELPPFDGAEPRRYSLSLSF